ncbi:MAG: ankyrin repeat domain-containing protein [Rhizobium sp.]|nr:ankyrin repeat domain-containing protein [Rhizobium sp.]
MPNPALDIEAAYLRGDLAALRAALGNPPDFPHTRDDCGGSCLINAIYRAPVSLVAQLLELGAHANEAVDDGFPPLFAALGTTHADAAERVALLLRHGANPQQRGVNDYTALHQAACADNAEAVRLLLAAGADPQARTRIDHYATALEEAEHFGHHAGAEALRRMLA